MSESKLQFQLEARVTEDNRLLVSVEVDSDEEGKRVKIESPGLSLTDFKVVYPDAESITLRVRDFYHNNTGYKVYGRVLGDDCHCITDYWQDVRAGIEYTFAIPKDGEGRPPVFIVGARPTNRAFPEPTPSIPGSGLPAKRDGKEGGG